MNYLITKPGNYSAALSGINLPHNLAGQYASTLLADLGAEQEFEQQTDHPALAFRRSGLTGPVLPLPLMSHMDGAMLALRSIAPDPDVLPVNGCVLIGERSRILSKDENHIIRENCMLIECADGRLAVNLARDDDWDLLPAWLEIDIDHDWSTIAKHLRARSADDLLARGVELGLPLAKEQFPEFPSNWFAETKFESGIPKNTPLVIDFSSLWAGPLASNLLQLMGARVIKIECANRPDGARRGNMEFYALMNGGKESAVFDFRDRSDLASLKRLLTKADIVIEASRPRAFEQIGLRAEEFAAENPGMVWARLTAYGRSSNRIGFGDDIGVSAGLSEIMHRAYGCSEFVGDAIADPVSGLHMALAIWAKYQRGGGCVLDFSMCDILRYAVGECEINPDIAAEWNDFGRNGPITSLSDATFIGFCA